MTASSRRIDRLTLTAAVLCGLAAGCYETPEFARASLIDRPRILAMVAEPPEVRPGGTVELSVMVAGAEIDEVHWSACGTFNSVVSGGSQYGENMGDQGCADRPLVIGTGERVRLDTLTTLALFEDDALAQTALGSLLPPETISAIRDGVGIAFSIEANVLAGGKRLRGLKHVLLSQRETPNKNPPPPVFLFNGTKIMGSSEPFTCKPVTGAVAEAEPGTSVKLQPVMGPSGSEQWLETYPVLDARGNTAERTEQAFYAWFATTGKLSRRETHAPDRDNVWELPLAVSCARMWVVLRDAHGGTSACMLRVQIGPAPGCDTFGD